MKLEQRKRANKIIMKCSQTSEAKKRVLIWTKIIEGSRQWGKSRQASLRRGHGTKLPVAGNCRGEGIWVGSEAGKAMVN